MSKEEIFNYFYTNNTNLDVQSIILTLLGGLLIGAIIFITYKKSYKGVMYNERYNVSLIMTLLISVVIMQMISSNIVISLGMVGALSIVRFRTAIKDPRDTVFMFWAISEGLAVGSGNFKLAIVTTLFISMITIAFTLLKYSSNKYLLIVIGDRDKLDNNKILEKLKDYTTDTKIRNISRDDKHQEIIIELKTKGEINLEMIKVVSEISGVNSINYIAESGERVG